MKTIVFTIAFAMMTVVAFGQNNQQAKAANKTQTESNIQTRKGPNFVDKNKNGICDNYEQGTRPARGQGKNSQGAKFVDKNKDGVCDNYQSGNRQGHGKGQGRGSRK